ncbi:MAG TPA: hypothetical protein PKW98_14775 [Candidatus Wallbacteria bacterium]|nr:hypothetical protein [Candidatus Wallbacteria bacterium]HPG59082.1 hypothetical protein [Candidatus Wallbacteria bacterium]
MQNLKRMLTAFLLCALVLFNNGCLTEDKSESEPVKAAFTNLTAETVLLYIDGKIETQIFADTTYWIELPAGHHKYAVLDKNTREELKAGDFLPGDKINIMPKS